MQINEVSKQFDLSQDTLRYYELIGLLPPVPRTASGIRNYDEDSLGWIQFIKCMKGAGLPIEALIEYASLYQQGDPTIEARKTLLLEQRDALQTRIKEMQETLHRLNFKIALYEQGEMTEAKMKQRKESTHHE